MNSSIHNLSVSSTKEASVSGEQLIINKPKNADKTARTKNRLKRLLCVKSVSGRSKVQA